MMKYTKNICSRILALVLTLCMLGSMLPAAFADDYEDQLAEIQKKKTEATEKRKTAQQNLDDLKDEQAAAIEEKMALEERKIATEEEIVCIEQEIQVYDDKILQKQKDVEAALTREELQLQKYRVRVRAMEESSGFNILDIILNAHGFGDLLTAIDDYQSIMNSDVMLYNEYQAAREEHEKIEAEYEELKADCEEKQKTLEKEKEELQNQITESEELIAQLEEEIKEAEEELEAMERAEAAASSAVTSFMNNYYRQQAAAQQAAQQAAAQQQAQSQNSGSTGSGNDQQAQTTTEESAARTQTETTQPQTESTSSQSSTAAQESSVSTTVSGGSGSFCWPFPGHTTVTSVFGYRQSTGTYHTGVDIDGYQSMGAAIVASDGGSVIMAQYNGGYGNCIIIDHGNGYSTLYAHLSSMSVGVGSSVSKGQTIGGVGNTGTCYGIDGIHLHFEIRVNGTAVDPLGYLSGYTIYNG